MFFVKWKGWRYLFVLLSLAFVLQLTSGNAAAATLGQQGQYHSCGINFTGHQCHIHQETCGTNDGTGDASIGIYEQAFDGSDPNFDGNNQICFKGRGTVDLDEYLTPDGQQWGRAVSGLNPIGTGVLADDDNPQHFLGFRRSEQFNNLKNIPLLDGSGDWNDRGRFLTLYSPY